MNPIDTARQLLSDASPELRRAVGDLLEAARQAGEDAFSFGTKSYWSKSDAHKAFARKLIETKSETKDGRE